jgi:dynein heavy chain
VANFSDEIRVFADDITSMTLKLYDDILARLPPTPSKFHYIFNLRDIGRVFEGLTLSTTDNFSKLQQFLRLWRNECLRVFHDRLINEEDKKIVIHSIEGLCSGTKTADYVLRDPCLFGDFRHALHPENVRLYEDLLDYHAVKAIFQEIMEEGNKLKPGPSLVLFDDALEHLIRIHRVMRLTKGHALLIGVGGYSYY